MDSRDKRLRGGINALIPDRSRQREEEAEAPRAAAMPEKQEANPSVEVVTYGTTEEERGLTNDIIDTVEDEALREALHKRRMSKRGRPRKNQTARDADNKSYTRFCTIFRRDQIAKIKEISFRETLTLKELFEAILGEAISNYESSHGELIPCDRSQNRSERAANLFRSRKGENGNTGNTSNTGNNE